MSSSANDILVPETRCPVETCRVDTADGYHAVGVFRRPSGDTPSPVIVFLHGGLDPLPLEALQAIALHGWTANRFLAAGYTVVVPTRRARFDADAPDGWRLDSLAMIAAVRPADGRLALYGSSGGSDLAFEIAGDVQPVAVVAEEPATSVVTGILDRPPSSASDAWPDDPSSHYTETRRRRTRAVLNRIDCPILITQGDQRLDGVDQLRAIHEVLIPELRDLGKTLVEARFPGQTHGFAFALGATPDPVAPSTSAAARVFFEQAESLVRSRLSTPPIALD